MVCGLWFFSGDTAVTRETLLTGDPRFVGEMRVCWMSGESVREPPPLEVLVSPVVAVVSDHCAPAGPAERAGELTNTGERSSPVECSTPDLPKNLRSAGLSTIFQLSLGSVD